MPRGSHETSFVHGEELTHDGHYSEDGEILDKIRENQQLFQTRGSARARFASNHLEKAAPETLSPATRAGAIFPGRL